MNKIEVLNNLNSLIKEIYKSENLNCIQGLDESFKINQQQVFSEYFEVVEKNTRLSQSQFNYLKNIEDIIYCSDEIMYFLANAYLYKPLLNSPIEDQFFFSNQIVYLNRQNLASKRYYMFLDVVSEKLYNYWDRIGDLIASFFPELLKPNEVYFNTALNIIPSDFHANTGYIWLKEFSSNDYKSLNGKRKNIVHYTTTNTTEKHKHLNVKSLEDAEKWEYDRHNLADFYKQQLYKTIDGFFQTLVLVKEIDSKIINC